MTLSVAVRCRMSWKPNSILTKLGNQVTPLHLKRFRELYGLHTILQSIPRSILLPMTIILAMITSKFVNATVVKTRKTVVFRNFLLTTTTVTKLTTTRKMLTTTVLTKNAAANGLKILFSLLHQPVHYQLQHPHRHPLLFGRLSLHLDLRPLLLQHRLLRLPQLLHQLIPLQWDLPPAELLFARLVRHLDLRQPQHPHRPMTKRISWKDSSQEATILD
mmetsp:Transcript_21207/g.50415  ORF Transcript_21207/g.50415 Transcript_21207/m.50415 type:complete len:218 (+) Transcript_21207:2315-2968(+)